MNLEGFVDIQLVPGEGHDGGRWAVEGLLRDGSSARLLEGGRAECQDLLDEVALAVWAAEVGAGAGAHRQPPDPPAADLGHPGL